MEATAAAETAMNITFKSARFQVIPAGIAQGGTYPAEDVIVELSDYIPAVIMVSSFVLYWFILVPFVFPALKPATEESKKRLQSFRDIHNILLFLYSGIVTAITFRWLYLDGQFNNRHDFLCKPLEGTWLRVVSVSFTISKIFEWGDTAYIIWLGKKPPIFLHIYHHATTFWLFCLVMNLPGTEKGGMLLNGAVHTLMYTHYWRKWPKSLVPIITVLQIAQLATVTYIWSIVPLECPVYANVPYETPLEFLVPYLMVPVYLFLFVKFFVERFITCGCGGRKKEKEL